MAGFGKYLYRLNFFSFQARFDWVELKWQKSFLPSLHIQNVTGILSKCIQGGDFSNNEYFLESSLWYLKSGFKWHKKCSNTNENSFNNVKRRYRRLNMHDEAWTALDWCYCRITKLFQWCKFRATGTFTPCMAPFLQSLSWKKRRKGFEIEYGS